MRKPFSFSQKRTTTTLEEAAEWFCDNPNYEDIEDELRLIDAEAEERGRQWAIDLFRARGEQESELVLLRAREKTIAERSVEP
jgi:hypothetical protein